MNILVTGAKGFIGRNLIATLHNIAAGKDRSFGLDTDLTVFEYDVDTDPMFLEAYCKNADFVFHLAGVNRPQNPEDFMKGNFGFSSELLENLKKHKEILLSHVRVLQFYDKLHKGHLDSLVSLAFRILRKPLECNLLGKNPSLFLFNIYKVGYLCYIMRK